MNVIKSLTLQEQKYQQESSPPECDFSHIWQNLKTTLFPPPVYYQSNEWAGIYGIRERDHQAWSAKQEWKFLSSRNSNSCYFFFLFLNVLLPLLDRAIIFFLRSVLASRPWIQSSRSASHLSCFWPAGDKKGTSRSSLNLKGQCRERFDSICSLNIIITNQSRYTVTTTCY